MQDKIKNIIITIGFVVIIMAIFLINIIVKDEQISITERRKLAQFPELSISKILNGDFMDNLEKYAEDQFINRDFFRTIKSLWSGNIFRQKDNNKLFEIDGAIYKMEYPLKENNIQKSAQKIKYVYDNYLKDMNVYYSIIPDKNYYLENDDHLKLDYNKVIEYCNMALKIEQHPKSYINERFSLDNTVYDLLSISYYNIGDIDNAIKNIDLALEYTPNDERLINNKKIFEKEF